MIKYLPTFKIPVIAGRNFSPDYPSDSMHSVIVNETFVKEAGWKLSNAVGQVINFMDEKNRQATIIGVIKDYHFTSLKEKITPELFSMDSTTTFYGQVWVKIGQDNVPQTLSLLESTYKKLVPLFPYSYQFMDDVNAKNYLMEAKWKQIISIASGLFVLISCMGLLGLVIISIEQRTKEIGIRKVLGCGGVKNCCAYFKRIYHPHFNCLCDRRSRRLLFRAQMAAGFCLSNNYWLVDVCVSWSIGDRDCIADDELQGNKSGDSEPCEIFTNRMIL